MVRRRCEGKQARGGGLAAGYWEDLKSPPAPAGPSITDVGSSAGGGPAAGSGSVGWAGTPGSKGGGFAFGADAGAGLGPALRRKSIPEGEGVAGRDREGPERQAGGDGARVAHAAEAGGLAVARHPSRKIRPRTNVLLFEKGGIGMNERGGGADRLADAVQEVADRE